MSDKFQTVLECFQKGSRIIKEHLFFTNASLNITLHYYYYIFVILFQWNYSNKILPLNDSSPCLWRPKTKLIFSALYDDSIWTREFRVQVPLNYSSLLHSIEETGSHLRGNLRRDTRHVSFVEISENCETKVKVAITSKYQTERNEAKVESIK